MAEEIRVGLVALVLEEMELLTQLEQLLELQIQVVVAVVQGITATVGRRRLAQAAPASSFSKSTFRGHMKVYKFLGIDTAMQMLRPGAKWEISNNQFTRWDDPRPCPSIEEVYWVMEKIKEFEDSIPTMWLPEQLEQMGIRQQELEEALG